MTRQPPLKIPALVDRRAELSQFAHRFRWSAISADELAALLIDDWGGSGPFRLDATLSLAELEDAGAVLLTSARAVLRGTRALGIAPDVPAREGVGLRLELTRPFRPPGFGDLRAGHKISFIGPAVDPLHWMQALLEVAGLLEWHPVGFELTAEGHRLLAPERAGELYAHLFRTMFRHFDLAYLDQWPEVPEVQDLVPHWLWAFTGLMGCWPTSADTFVTLTIPAALGLDLDERAQPARLRHVIQTRVFDALADFGLLEPWAGDDEHEELGDVRFRPAPLFARFLGCRIPPELPRRRDHLRLVR